jgi:hypothetical protein
MYSTIRVIVTPHDTPPRVIEVTPDNGWTRWEVNLHEFAEPVAVTICVRRDTGLEFTRTLKPHSANWKKAVRLARIAEIV